MSKNNNNIEKPTFTITDSTSATVYKTSHEGLIALMQNEFRGQTEFDLADTKSPVFKKFSKVGLKTLKKKYRGQVSNGLFNRVISCLFSPESSKLSLTHLISHQPGEASEPKKFKTLKSGIQRQAKEPGLPKIYTGKNGYALVFHSGKQELDRFTLEVLGDAVVDELLDLQPDYEIASKPPFYRFLLNDSKSLARKVLEDKSFWSALKSKDVSSGQVSKLRGAFRAATENEDQVGLLYDTTC